MCDFAYLGILSPSGLMGYHPLSIKGSAYHPSIFGPSDMIGYHPLPIQLICSAYHPLNADVFADRCQLRGLSLNRTYMCKWLTLFLPFRLISLNLEISSSENLCFPMRSLNVSMSASMISSKLSGQPSGMRSLKKSENDRDLTWENHVFFLDNKREGIKVLFFSVPTISSQTSR